MADETPKPAAPIKRAATRAAPKGGANSVAARAKPAVTKPKAMRAKSGTSPKAAAKATLADVTASAKQSFKDGAAQISKDAGTKARSYAEEGKARAGGVLDELARLMGDAAGTVDEKVGAQYGQYARGAADAVSNFSSSLKSRNVDDLIGDVREFARKSPAVAIGTAAALGFVMVRLIKAGLDSDRA
ncbi:MAG: hypothetical protein M3R41_09135 [Pseudomonadota bacterium]|nr:hypothetical protein [Pseudomonadota bacterium]